MAQSLEIGPFSFPDPAIAPGFLFGASHDRPISPATKPLPAVW